MKPEELEKIEQETSKNIFWVATTILGASLVLLPTEASKFPAGPFLIISMVLFSSTIFFYLWYKKRYPLKRDIFEKELKPVIEKYADKIANYGETMIIKSFENFEENKKVHKDVIISYINNLAQERTLIFKKIFRKPLKERASVLKFIFDILSEKLLYSTFFLGIFTFITFLVIFINFLR